MEYDATDVDLNDWREGKVRQKFHEILEEKQPATPMTALQIGNLCGNGPDPWRKRVLGPAPILPAPPAPY